MGHGVVLGNGIEPVIVLRRHGRQPGLELAPDLFQYLEKERVIDLEFRCHKRIEVVAVEVGFRPLGKELLLIGCAIMPDRPAGIEKDLLVFSRGHRPVISLLYLRMIETKNKRLEDIAQ